MDNTKLQSCQNRWELSSSIPTWASGLPRGVGIVGGGVVGAGQTSQPQEDRGQPQDRGHVTRGQDGHNVWTSQVSPSPSLWSKQPRCEKYCSTATRGLTLVPDTRRSGHNWQLRLRDKERPSDSEAPRLSEVRGSEPRHSQDLGVGTMMTGGNRLASSFLSCGHRGVTFSWQLPAPSWWSPSPPDVIPAWTKPS